MFKRNHPDRDVIFFGSVCSGIEAASVAWSPLGWKAAWLSEIEPFPSAVLAHHYPETPNLGDMTALPARILAREVPAPDVFCGGTPCQAFSVAGLRRSLDDARGNLSLTFCEIADAIDTVRAEDGEQPAVIFWENVPGVLSTSDNAFGCFLAGLAGEDDPLVPPGGRWTNAGYVLGPKRAVAWRVTDAQYFGVAQRRRRVFVVASARTGFDPAAVLFEFEGMRRDTAPSREAGQGVTHATAPCLTSSGRGVERTGDTRGQDPVVACITMAHGQGGAEIGFDRGPTLTCNHEAPIAAYPVAHVDTMPCMTAGGPAETSHNQISGQMREQYVVPVCCVHGTQDPCVSTTTAFALGRNNGGENAIAFAFAENSRAEVRLEGGDGQRTGAISTGGGKPGQGVPMVAMTFQERGRDDGRSLEVGGDVAYALTAPNGGGRAQERNVLTPAMQVRRLTPRECERLQGFQWMCTPDYPGAWQDDAGIWWSPDYTNIPWRKKPASECPDGPRYKALGNSWAVPNVRWIGKRIDMFIKLSNWIS